MTYRDPRRERPPQDPHAELCIYWLSPHERARRGNAHIRDKRHVSRKSYKGGLVEKGSKTVRPIVLGCSGVLPIEARSPVQPRGCTRTYRPNLSTYDGDPE